MAYHATEAALSVIHLLSAEAARGFRRDCRFVRLLQLVVLPLDERLAAHTRHELAELRLLPGGVNLVRGHIPDAFERLHLRRLERLQLQNLKATRRADRLG